MKYTPTRSVSLLSTMDSKTNQSKRLAPSNGAVPPHSVARKRARRVTARRAKSKPNFWEAAVESNVGQPPTDRKQPLPTQGVSESTPQNETDLNKSIEALFLSKTRKPKSAATAPNKLYQEETCRPIVCLVFVLPFLIFYEIGSILLGSESLRSGIDQWFHQATLHLGFGQLVVLPIVTIATMIVWHHRNDDHWRIRIPVVLGMGLEAIGLGLILYWAANAISLWVGGTAATEVIGQAGSANAWWASIVTCVGSGIYEELIFRIIFLIPMILWAGKLVQNHKLAMAIGVVAVSLIFAAVHYNVFNPAGNQFELSSFVFRFIASIVFCVLFLFRGFGIAVGAHVAYDVLTQV